LTTNSFVVRCFDHHPCLVYQQGAEPFLRERLLLFRLEKTRPELSYLRASAPGSRLSIKLVVVSASRTPLSAFCSGLQVYGFRLSAGYTRLLPDGRSSDNARRCKTPTRRLVCECEATDDGGPGKKPDLLLNLFSDWLRKVAIALTESVGVFDDYSSSHRKPLRQRRSKGYVVWLRSYCAEPLQSRALEAVSFSEPRPF